MIRRNVSSGKVSEEEFKKFIITCTKRMDLQDERTGKGVIPHKDLNGMISQVKEIIPSLELGDSTWFKSEWYPIISMVGGVLPWKTKQEVKTVKTKIERRSDVFKRVLGKSLPSDFKGIVSHMVSEWEGVSGKRLQGEMEDFTRKSLQTLESWNVIKKDKSGKWEIV